MTLAHFTLTELPGSVAILLAGALLGVAVYARALRVAAVGLALAAGLAMTGRIGDSAGWAEATRTAIDAAWLVALAAALIALAVQLRRRAA